MTMSKSKWSQIFSCLRIKSLRTDLLSPSDGDDDDDDDDDERHAKLMSVVMVSRDSTLNDENGPDSSSIMSSNVILP